MANFVFTKAKEQTLLAAINYSTADLRILLVMTNTSLSTAGQEDIATLGAATTLDEYDGSGYTTAGAALATKVVTLDNANNRAFLDADDLTFAALGAGTRSCKAAILYKFVTNVGASLPIAYIDTGGFPFAGNGSNVTLQWNAAGILQAN